MLPKATLVALIFLELLLLSTATAAAEHASNRDHTRRVEKDTAAAAVAANSRGGRVRAEVASSAAAAAAAYRGPFQTEISVATVAFADADYTDRERAYVLTTEDARMELGSGDVASTGVAASNAVMMGDFAAKGTFRGEDDVIVSKKQAGFTAGTAPAAEEDGWRKPSFRRGAAKADLVENGNPAFMQDLGLEATGVDDVVGDVPVTGNAAANAVRPKLGAAKQEGQREGAAAAKLPQQQKSALPTKQGESRPEDSPEEGQLARTVPTSRGSRAATAQNKKGDDAVVNLALEKPGSESWDTGDDEIPKDEMTKDEMKKGEMTKGDMTKDDMTKDDGMTKDDMTKDYMTKDGPESHPILCTTDQWFTAARDNDAETVSDCIDGGMNVDTKDAEGKTALHTAACQNAKETIKVLLDVGAIVEPCQSFEEFKATALGCALMAGGIESLALLAARSDPTQVCGKFSRKPIEEASTYLNVLPEQISILAVTVPLEILDSAVCLAKERDVKCQSAEFSSKCGAPIARVLFAWGASYTDAAANCDTNEEGFDTAYATNAKCMDTENDKLLLQTTSTWSSARWSAVACDKRAAQRALRVGVTATLAKEGVKTQLAIVRDISQKCGCPDVQAMATKTLQEVDCEEKKWFDAATKGHVAYIEKCVGKFLNTKDGADRTAVYLAACSTGGPFIPVLEVLAANNPEPAGCPDGLAVREKQSAIMCALEKGNLVATKVLAPISDLSGSVGQCPNTPLETAASSPNVDRATLSELIGYMVAAGLLELSRYQNDLADNSFWNACRLDAEEPDSAFRMQVLMSWGIPMTEKVGTRSQSDTNDEAVHLLARCANIHSKSCKPASITSPEDYTPLLTAAISCDAEAAKYWFTTDSFTKQKFGSSTTKLEVLLARTCGRSCECPSVLTLIDEEEAKTKPTTTKTSTITTATTTITTSTSITTSTTVTKTATTEGENDNIPPNGEDEGVTETSTSTTMTTTTTEDIDGGCVLPPTPHAATPPCLEIPPGSPAGKPLHLPHGGQCTPQCEAGYQLRPDSPPKVFCNDGHIPPFTCVNKGVMLGATIATATSLMGSATAAATGGVTAASSVASAGGTVGSAGASAGAGVASGSAALSAETAGFAVSPGVAAAAPDATQIAKAFKAQGRGLREGGIGSDNLHHDFFNTELEDQGRCSMARIKRFFKKYGSLTILFCGSIHCIYQGMRRGASLWPGVIFSLLTFVGICVVAFSSPGSQLARTLQAITAKGENIHPRFWGRMELCLSIAVATAVLIERGTSFLGAWSASILVVGGVAYYKRWRCPCRRRWPAAVVIYICGGVVALTVVIINLLAAAVGGVAATLSCWTALSKGAETAMDIEIDDEEILDAIADADIEQLDAVGIEMSEMPVMASTLTDFDSVDYIEADDGVDCALQVLDSNWIAAALEALMAGKESSDTLASMHVKYQERPPLEGTIEQAKDFGHWVATVWTEKEGSLLEELCSLLRQPHDGGARGRETPVRIELELLQALVAITKDWYGQDYEETYRRTPLALFCASLFTMQDADIDRLCLFPDVPPCPKDLQAQDAYEHYRSYRESLEIARNPQFFEVSTWAMRICWDTFAEGKYPIEETFNSFHSFVKWLSCISCFRQVIEPSLTVYRVFKNVPEDILEQLKQKQNGGIVFWPCPTSATQGRELAEQIAMANTPEKNVLFSVQGVREGWRLSHLSQYPNEAEILLPMCSVLKVRSVQLGPPLKVFCFYEACSLPIGFERAVVRDLRQCDASMRNQRASRRSARANPTPGPSFAASEVKPMSPIPSISVSAVSSMRDGADDDDDESTAVLVDQRASRAGEARKTLIDKPRGSTRPSAVWATPKEVTGDL